MNKIAIDEKRNYGIDALRMLSMFMVVILHILGHGGVLDNANGVQYACSWVLETACYCAVDVFAMISGFVGYRAKHRYSSIAEMWLRVVFYTLPCGVLYWYLTKEFSLKRKIFYFLFPVFGQQYWYFTMYFCLFFFMPLINKAIESISRKQFRNCCIAFVAIFCILQHLSQADLFYSNGGSSAIWLMVLYFIGAYIGKYNAFAKLKKYQAFLGYLICTAVAFGVKMYLHYNPVTILGMQIFEDTFIISYTSIAMVGQTVFLICLFRNLNLRDFAKKVLTVTAPLFFSVYIIHDNKYIRDLGIGEKFSIFADYSAPVLILIVLGSATAIFVACTVIDYIRAKIFELLKVKKILSNIESKLIKDEKYNLKGTHA